MIERNYDFLKRHWCFHKPGMRDDARHARSGEVELDSAWKLGCAREAPKMVHDALRDFQDYLQVSMGLSLVLTGDQGDHVLWLEQKQDIDRGFVIDADDASVTLSVAPRNAYKAVVYLEDCMNLEGAPVIEKAHTVRRPLYDYRAVHSGSGIDYFPDSELAAIVHGGYDCIAIFLKDFDVTAAGHCNVAELMERAENFGLGVMVFNYMQSFVHPDDADAAEVFAAKYGELFRRYPRIKSIFLCGESLEFPSKDPATTGKPHSKSTVDGIPDTRPSPGWYPCIDYPEYLKGIEEAIHGINPEAEVIFETYNWCFAPLDLRKRFLDALPKGRFTVSVTYEIYEDTHREGLRTPVMDYTVSTSGPGYYFTTECAAAHEAGLPVEANSNTAGIGWDFGTVPYVPTPWRWLDRNLRLREAHYKYGLVNQYATHHYGWWDSVAADIGKWASWDGFEPDYEEIIRKVARRDYGEACAPHALAAWRTWGEAMDFYVASNEDQYGPWRVGPAYPFIFHPDITRTFEEKEIRFPTSPHAHFGWMIIKTLYHPFENIDQSPAFMRYPADLRSLDRMLELWNQGLAEARQCGTSENGIRLAALGEFIRNSIITTIHIKQWWLLNMSLQISPDAETALRTLDEIDALALAEIDNARNTIPAVEQDSRLGWEPSMEYVCDRWHLEWKIRQVESARLEIASYRKIITG